VKEARKECLSCPCVEDFVGFPDCCSFFGVLVTHIDPKIHDCIRFRKTANKSKIIYIPNFEECLILRKKLYDWESEPDWEYFTSFAETKRQMVSYWQNVIGNAQVNLRTARRLIKSDCI
jgi:hypothetical protein